MSNLANAGDFCPNGSCSDYGKTDTADIIKHGTTPKGLQRYRCKTCGKTFSENTGTVFYNKHTPASEIVETLALVAEGMCVAGLSRAKGYKEETISNWLDQAAEHSEKVEDVLMSEYEIERGQIDGLWSYVGNKGEKKTIRKPRGADSSGAQP
jgi:transposase-like protein